MSYQDKKSWFVFEVEIDGSTQISHKILITGKTFCDDILLGDEQSHRSGEEGGKTSCSPVTHVQRYFRVFRFQNARDMIQSAARDQACDQSKFGEQRIQGQRVIRQNV